MSAVGDKVVRLSKTRFWVFDTKLEVTFACTGHFPKGNNYHYAQGDRLQPQRPFPGKHGISVFSSAAISSHFLAIGCQGRIMTFIIEGVEAGRWVTVDEFDDKEAVVETLTFSSDGKELLAVVRQKYGNSFETTACILSSDQFPKERLSRKYDATPTATNLEKLALPWTSEFRAKEAVFATQGTMAAICTYWVQSVAGIQLLKKTGSTWVVWGKLQPVPLFPRDDNLKWGGIGITGIS